MHGSAIPTIIVDEMVNSFIFHNNNKCITGNGQMIINLGANSICQVEIIPFAQNIYKLS